MTSSAVLLVPALVIMATAPLGAGEFATLKEQIATARKALTNMVLYLDKRGPEQQKQVKETADAVSAHFAKLKAPASCVQNFL